MGIEKSNDRIHNGAPHVLDCVIYFFRSLYFICTTFHFNFNFFHFVVHLHSLDSVYVWMLSLASNAIIKWLIHIAHTFFCESININLKLQVCSMVLAYNIIQIINTFQREKKIFNILTWVGLLELHAKKTIFW